MPEPFLGSKLTLARNFRAITQSALANEVSASPALLSLIERGRQQPSADLADALGEVLGFERSFFSVPFRDPFLEGQCNFRRRARTPEKIRKRVLAHGTLLASLVVYLREHVKLPTQNVPTFRVTNDEDIEEASLECRRRWGLGVDRPIQSMGRVLENAGVVVATLDDKSEDVDAFSRIGETAFVILTSAKGSTSRARMDAGHEMGHLVLHAHGPSIAYKEIEAQAFRFSSAFLMPAHAFALEFPRSHRALDLSALLDLKQRWKVSVAAMVYRAYQLGIINAVVYRRAYKTLSARGWRKHEPSEPPPEKPELLAIALAALRDRHEIPYHDVCTALGWTSEVFHTVAGLPVPDRDMSGVVVSLPEFRALRAI